MFRDLGNPPLGPFTEGEKTNPIDSALMATSGALALAGNYEVIATIGASAPAHFALERRNVADDANVGNVPIIYGPAGQHGQYRFLFHVEIGERLRVIMDDALTGSAAVTLNLEKLT